MILVLIIETLFDFQVLSIKVLHPRIKVNSNLRNNAKKMMRIQFVYFFID